MTASVREREGRAQRSGQARELSPDVVRERQQLDSKTRVIAFRKGQSIDKATLSPRVQDAIAAAQRAVIDAEPKKPAVERRIVVNASGTATVIDIVTGHQEGVSVDATTGALSLKNRTEIVGNGWFRGRSSQTNYGEAKVARVVLGSGTGSDLGDATVVEARGGEVKQRTKKTRDLDGLFADAYDHAVSIKRTPIKLSGHESFHTALRVDLGEASRGDESTILRRIRHALAVIDHDPAYASVRSGVILLVGAGASSVAVDGDKDLTKFRIAGVTKKYQTEGMPLLDPTKKPERGERTGVLKIGVPAEHLHDVRLLTTEGLIRVVPGNQAEGLRRRKVEFVADAPGEMTLGYRQSRAIEREVSRTKPRLEALLRGKNSIVEGRNPDPSEIVIALGLRAPRLDKATRAPEGERDQARRNGLGLQRLVQAANEHVRDIRVKVETQFKAKGNQRSRYDIAVQVVADAYRTRENLNGDLVLTLVETIAPKPDHEKLSAAAVRAVEALSAHATDQIGRKRLQALLREAGMSHDAAGRLAQTLTRDAVGVAGARDRRGRAARPEGSRKAPTEAGAKAALLDFYAAVQGMSERARTARATELRALIGRVPGEEVQARLSDQLGSIIAGAERQDPTPRQVVIGLLKRGDTFVTREEAHAILADKGYDGPVIEAYLAGIYGRRRQGRRVQASPNGTASAQ